MKASNPYGSSDAPVSPRERGQWTSTLLITVFSMGLLLLPPYFMVPDFLVEALLHDYFQMPAIPFFALAILIAFEGIRNRVLSGNIPAFLYTRLTSLRLVFIVFAGAAAAMTMIIPSFESPPRSVAWFSHCVLGGTAWGGAMHLALLFLSDLRGRDARFGREFAGGIVFWLIHIAAIYAVLLTLNAEMTIRALLEPSFRFDIYPAGVVLIWLGYIALASRRFNLRVRETWLRAGMIALCAGAMGASLKIIQAIFSAATGIGLIVRVPAIAADMHGYMLLILIPALISLFMAAGYQSADTQKTI